MGPVYAWWEVKVLLALGPVQTSRCGLGRLGWLLLISSTGAFLLPAIRPGLGFIVFVQTNDEVYDFLSILDRF
jgi:hypothetical protein